MELNDYLEAVANLMMDIPEDFNLTSDAISLEEDISTTPEQLRKMIGLDKIEVVAKKVNSDCHP
jgi:hypothetical protein